MKNLFILSIVFFWSGIISAQQLDSLFQKGNQSYTQGNYDQAIEYYKKIISSNFESPELYLNLGNAYFKIQDYGHARLYFEKAHKQDPFLTDLESNIELVQSFVTDKITILPLISIKLSLLDWMSFLNSLTVIILIILISLFSYFLIYLNSVSKFETVKRYLFIAVLTISILLQLGLITYIWLDYSLDSAIVTDSRVDVKSEPLSGSTTVFTIHSATRVFIKNTYEDWFFIQLENGNTGWLEIKSVGKI